MSQEIEREARETYQRYTQTRDRIDRGELPWGSLSEFFTDDAVFIDPAWGRIEGRDNIREFMRESMLGLEDWSFPEIWTIVDGRRVVTMWAQRIGKDADGARHTQPGVSILYYAGDGKFCYELDLLNMAHVNEELRAMHWKPTGDFTMPPVRPERDWSLPDAWKHLA